MAFSDDLRAALVARIQSRGVSTVARECGIDHGQLGRFAAGKRSLTLPTVDRLVRYLPVTITLDEAQPLEEK